LFKGAVGMKLTKKEGKQVLTFVAMGFIMGLVGVPVYDSAGIHYLPLLGLSCIAILYGVFID